MNVPLATTVFQQQQQQQQQAKTKKKRRSRTEPVGWSRHALQTVTKRRSRPTGSVRVPWTVVIRLTGSRHQKKDKKKTTPCEPIPPSQWDIDTGETNGAIPSKEKKNKSTARYFYFVGEPTVDSCE